MIMEIEPSAFEKRYPVSGITKESESPWILTEIGSARGFKMKGGVIDTERTAIMLLDEFRGGKLGRISLERPLS